LPTHTARLRRKAFQKRSGHERKTIGRKIRNLHALLGVTRRMRERIARASHVMYSHQMHIEWKRQDNRESLLSKRGGRKGREEKRRTRQDSEDLRSQRRVGIGFSFLLSARHSLEIIRFLLGRVCDVFVIIVSFFCDEVL
jgi:hypothetical protein